MKQPIEQRGGERGVVVEDFGPVLVGPVGAQEDGAAFVTLRDNLEQ